MAGSISHDGDYIVIRTHKDDAQSLRIALQPCPCCTPKSTATAAIRARFVKALGRALESMGVSK